MRASVLPLGLCICLIFTGSTNAGALQNVSLANSAEASSPSDSYRDYILDLSQISGQHNYSQIANAMQQQLDIVESVGLSPRVLKFFHSIPVTVDEAACLGAEAGDKAPILAAGCYGPSRPQRLSEAPTHGTYYDNQKSEWVNRDPFALAEDTRLGLIMVRPRVISAETPVLLHEMLHAYHRHMMAHGFSNPSILFYFKDAKGKTFYPSDAYLLTNEKEFFAVTASVFLYGRDDKEPFTRSKLKEKQPDYFKYLVWLFGFDPDQAPGSPVASAN